MLVMTAIRALSKMYRSCFLGNNRTVKMDPGMKKNDAAPITSRRADRTTSMEYLVRLCLDLARDYVKLRYITSLGWSGERFADCASIEARITQHLRSKSKASLVCGFAPQMRLADSNESPSSSAHSDAQ